jgi:hypothetical protein
MEPEDSLPWSQEPATGPCDSRPHPHILGLSNGLYPSDCPTTILNAFLVPLMRTACTHTSHPPWFDNSNNICWKIQIVKLINMLVSPAAWWFRFFYIQIFSSAPCSQTHTICLYRWSVSKSIMPSPEEHHLESVSDVIWTVHCNGCGRHLSVLK